MSVTHLAVGNAALDILKEEKPDVYEFYTVKHKTIIPYLHFGFIDPDLFEMKRGTHYYVYQPGPNTGQYYPPGNGSKYYSARIHLEEHYTRAILYFHKKQYRTGLHQLGMALHYLADCCTPPHTAGIQFPMNPLDPNPHHVFEKYVDKHVDEYKVTDSKNLWGSLDGDKLGYSVNEMARISSSFKDVVLAMDENQYPKALPETIALSERYTAVLLEKFYRDVQSF